MSTVFVKHGNIGKKMKWIIQPFHPKFGYACISYYVVL